MSSSTALFIYSHKYTCIYMQLYASRLRTLVAVAVVGTQSVKHITIPFHAAIHFPAFLAATHSLTVPLPLPLILHLPSTLPLIRSIGLQPATLHIYSIILNHYIHYYIHDLITCSHVYIKCYILSILYTIYTLFTLSPFCNIPRP